MKGRLYYCVGLPRSGKSYYSKKWINLAIDKPRVVISGDEFRKALHGNEFRIEAESTVYAMMDVATRALLNSGYDVLIDETSSTEQTILRYLRLDINAIPLFFSADEETCIKRALDTNKSYLVGPIKRISKQMDYLLKNWEEIIKRCKDYLNERKVHDVAC